ncbi:MAG: DUF4176 domain-containing protein [Christensenella sp.]
MINELERKKWIKAQERGKYLPIGSLIRLEGIDSPVLIIGKLQYNGDNTDKLYDYAGVDYPVGFVNPKEIWMFDMYKIIEVIQSGHESMEENELNKKISKFWKQHPEKR